MRIQSDWPKKPTQWIENRTLFISIPFTWNLPGVKREIMQRSFEWDTVTVGGPAVELMPKFFENMTFVKIGHDYPGVLQRVNPLATRTTTGCIRRCQFCGVGQARIEKGGFKCLDDWPDLPILCDNNLLAAPVSHFDRVIDRLKKHINVDFNQGIDARLLTKHHAKRFSELKGLRNGGIRLALDNMAYVDDWLSAFEKLRAAGIAKNKISSYALIGFSSGPEDAWSVCDFIESKNIKPYPQWFHDLNQLEKNIVTEKQKALGWTDYERRKIMQWFYQHKEAIKYGLQRPSKSGN
jgi:hypothetical protein